VSDGISEDMKLNKALWEMAEVLRRRSAIKIPSTGGADQTLPRNQFRKHHLPMSNIIAIPLNKLTRSARNVRKSGGDSIDDLATSILCTA
jgi:hypothetical protein